MRYDDVVRAAWAADPDFVTLCKSLYGSGATWETVAKDGPCSSDVSTPGSALARGKKKKIAVLDDRGIEKRRFNDVPRQNRSYKRDDNGRFSSFAGASAHAVVAGIGGAGAATAGTSLKNHSTALLETIKELRKTEAGRRAIALAITRTGGRAAGLAAIGGLAGAVAAHHGKAAYSEIHDRAMLEREHKADVQLLTRHLDLDEFTGGYPHNAQVTTSNPRGKDARTTITRDEDLPTLRYQGGLRGDRHMDGGPAFAKRAVDMAGEITEINEDKHQVFGWASIVEKNGQPVVDLQGDYIGIDELEKSAYDYVHKSRIGGAMHRRVGPDGQLISKTDKPYHAADLIESFVVTPEKIEKMGLPSSTPVGWWVGFKVNDPEVWDSVKSGDWKGFSIHGAGRRRAIGEVTDLDISGADLTR